MKNLAIFDEQIVIVEIDGEKRLGWVNLLKDEMSGKNKLYFFEDKGCFQQIDSQQIVKTMGTPENYLQDSNKTPWLLKIENYAIENEINLNMSLTLKMIEMSSGNFAPNLNEKENEELENTIKNLTPEKLNTIILNKIYSFAEIAHNTVIKKYLSRNELAEVIKDL